MFGDIKQKLANAVLAHVELVRAVVENGGDAMREPLDQMIAARRAAIEAGIREEDFSALLPPPEAVVAALGLRREPEWHEMIQCPSENDVN